MVGRIILFSAGLISLLPMFLQTVLFPLKQSLIPGGVCFAYDIIETDPYHWIEFYINYGEDTSRKLNISGYGKNDQEFYYELNITEPKYYDETIQTETWYSVMIPLEDFGANSKRLSKICIADGSEVGQATFWLDNVHLVGAFVD